MNYELRQADDVHGMYKWENCVKMHLQTHMTQRRIMLKNVWSLSPLTSHRYHAVSSVDLVGPNSIHVWPIVFRL